MDARLGGHADEVTRFSIQPLTILGVTGPFAVLAENIYELCESSFHVSCILHNPKQTD